MAQPTTPDYKVNYEDERFGKVEADKNQALTELEQTYGGMIGQTDQYYQQQIDATKQWADKQQQLQQEQTDFAIEQVQQQKQQAYKDYQKEQSGAYVDWQKQSNKYGTAAEQAAAAGLSGTGFSESSQVAMYNAYQNRVAVARDAHARAVLNYDNAIKDAQLQNNSVLAEIAYQALQKELELSLAGFQYKNQLVLEQANKKVELENTYYNRYLDVLNQINHENALAEEVRQYEQNFAEDVRQYEQSFAEDVRQYEQNYAFQQEQFAEEIRQYNEQYQLEIKQMDEQIRQYNQSYQQQVKEYNEGIRQFNEEIARLKAKDAREYELEIKNLELKKQQLAEEKKQYEAEQKLKQQQLALQKQQLEQENKQKQQQLALQKQQLEQESKLKQQQLAEEQRQFNESLKEQKRTNNAEIAYKNSLASKNNKASGSGTVKKSTSSSSSGSSGVKKTTTTNNNSSKVTIDTKSLSAVGLPVMTSEAKLASMVASGELNVKQVGNKLVFSRGSQPKGQSTLNKYTTLATRASK